MDVVYKVSYPGDLGFNPRMISDMIISKLEKNFEKIAKIELNLRGTILEMQFFYENNKHINNDDFNLVKTLLEEKLPLLKLNGLEFDVYNWYTKRLVLDIG